MYLVTFPYQHCVQVVNHFKKKESMLSSSSFYCGIKRGIKYRVVFLPVMYQSLGIVVS